MAETHRSHWSTFRMALSGALLLGALTVMGLVALPQSAAYAAATPNDGVQSMEYAKQLARCEGSGPYSDCNQLLKVGDLVVMTFTEDGVSCTFWIQIVTHAPSRFNGDIGQYDASADIVAISKKNARDCELLEIGQVGDKWYLFYYVVEKEKGKGKKGGK